MADRQRSGDDVDRLAEGLAAQTLNDHVNRATKTAERQKKAAKDLPVVLRHALLACRCSPSSAEHLQLELETRTSTQYRQAPETIRQGLVILDWLKELLAQSPYSTLLYYYTALVYIGLDYPDLASGSLYKALLLLDAIEDEFDEYHEQANEAFLAQCAYQETSGISWAATTRIGLHRTLVLKSLVAALQECGCFESAYLYAAQGSELDDDFKDILEDLEDEALVNSTHATEEPSTWSNRSLVRRETYPWNIYEPDRLNDLDTLNEMMQSVAPKLEVKAARLPALSSVTSDGQAEESIQLGVFAKEDLAPGEIVLKETSLLTANNKLQDALCDACSVELPELSDPAVENTVRCDDCEVVFCSQTCYDAAWTSYHPALCDRDVESIAKDVPVEQASDSLYSLLLLRTFAMAETQECHPLELKEVKYIWGDFTDVNYTTSPQLTLPFSFKNNVTLPLHMLEKMDIDIFANPQYDVWVFNTLYAKFRGTASARLSGLGGRAIRGPEVCAVHPMWCLANHSCDPNVSWRWGGEIRFTVRETRAEWQGKDKTHHNQPGVKKGEEILNHYCDLDLPVKERREWAAGALGGNCMCERCIWESQQAMA